MSMVASLGWLLLPVGPGAAWLGSLAGGGDLVGATGPLGQGF
jgi:hypothetical protein